MSTNITCDIDLRIFCAECGKELEGWDGTSHGDIIVDSCQYCKIEVAAKEE